MNNDWIPINQHMPPRRTVVQTKIDDEDGMPERNLQNLKLDGTGRLWWLPDDSMYVYYTPTHWRFPSPPQS